MSLAQALQQSGAIDSMARELGVDSRTAQSAASALLPAIVAGLGRSQLGGGGMGAGMGGGMSGGMGGGLADVLGSLAGGAMGGGQGASGMGASGMGASGMGAGMGGGLGGIGGMLLDQVMHRDPTPTQPGNDILGQIFGNKDVSRGVAEEVAGSTGISSDLLRRMLPILAMAVVGYMMKSHVGGGQAQSGMPDQFPGGAAAAQPGGGMFGGALGGLLGQVVTGMMRR